MTTITINKNNIEVKGHSNYAPLGKDIVCSAISTATIYTQKILQCDFKVGDDGYLWLDTTIPDGDYFGCYEHVIEKYIETVKELAKDYPNNVKVVMV